MRAILGVVLFLAFSTFFCIYIICFAHVASRSLSKEWVESTLIGVGLDQIVFEIMPGIWIGVLILMMEQCKCKRCSRCVIVFIEAYRVYKNLTDS